jgi:hypothetical protein
MSDDELKRYWDAYLNTGNPTSFLNAIQPPHLSKDLIEALFLSCNRKVKWELWPNISTKRDTLSTITFNNPFNKNGELCVILPQLFMEPNSHSLFAYAQTLFESIVKNCKTKENINLTMTRLFDAVLRKAYPVSDTAKEKCEREDPIGFLNQ